MISYNVFNPFSQSVISSWILFALNATFANGLFGRIDSDPFIFPVFNNG